MLRYLSFFLLAFLATGCSKPQEDDPPPPSREAKAFNTRMKRITFWYDNVAQKDPAKKDLLEPLLAEAKKEGDAKNYAKALQILGDASAKMKPKVEMETSMGKIVLELDPENAPVTVENFLKYVENKHYEGTKFHRVIADFMIQGGGFAAGPGMQEKPTAFGGIQNESQNGLSNARGTISMARTGDPHSASAQFFINVKDNPSLDAPPYGPQYGYAVFGKVISGMDVVDKIREVPTGKVAGHDDVPREQVVLEKVRLLS